MSYQPYHGRPEAPSPPSARGSDTSRQAARSVRKTIGTDEERVYSLIARRGYVGATDDELEIALGLRHQNASARRRTLELKQRVIKLESTRPTRSGRQAHVYVTFETFSELFAEVVPPPPVLEEGAMAEPPVEVLSG